MSHARPAVSEYLIWAVSPLAAKMDFVDKPGFEAFRLNFSLLKEAIDPNDVLDLCFQKHLVSKRQMEEIALIKENRGNVAACEKLLDVLMSNGREGMFQTFLEILESRPNLEYLARKLRGRLRTAIHEPTMYMQVIVHTIMYICHTLLHCIICIEGLN